MPKSLIKTKHCHLRIRNTVNLPKLLHPSAILAKKKLMSLSRRKSSRSKGKIDYSERHRDLPVKKLVHSLPEAYTCAANR